jgi:hypothetical protein
MRLAQETSMRSRFSVLLLAGSLGGCYVGSEDAPRSEIVDDPAGELAVAGAEVVPADRSMRHTASAWLDHEDSPIMPWCGAVLVAPDVAMTAARCVDGWDKSYLNIGFGSLSATAYPIAEIRVQHDAVDRQTALAAIRLEEPVRGIDPVELALPADRVCDVQSVSWIYVLRGEESSRGVWSGCLDDGELRATAGSPNCHGDMGVGAFLPDGSLAGIAVDAWSEGGCVPGHRIATVADNEAFFDLALELSQPPE